MAAQPAPDPEVAPAPASACADCGALLTGPYCAHCGQKAVDLDRPLGSLLRDLLDGLAAFDSRVVRTLRLLLASPGQLTGEYLAGRRTRYVPPLKLYLFVSFCFFLLATLVPLNVVHDASAVSEGDTGGVRIMVGGGKKSQPPAEPSAPAPDPSPAADTATSATSEDPSFEQRVEHAAADPEAFGRAFGDHLAKVAFLLVPLFAVGPKLLFRRPPRLYFHHLIFSLHLHAFGFLIAIFVLALGRVPGVGPQLAGLLNLSLPIYLFLALRRVYGQSRLATAWKTTVLTVVHTTALSLVMLGAVVATVGW